MGIVTAKIKSEGKPLEAIHEVLSIDVQREVNRIPVAEIVVLDGDPAQQKFALSDGAFFEPGKQVSIELGYEGSRTQSAVVFEGIVVKHTIEADARDTMLTVQLRDKAFGMTGDRKSEVYLKQTDAQLLKKIIGAAGLKAGKIPATKPTHEEMVRYHCTDWDFLLLRAEANNLLVKVVDGEISLVEIKKPASAKHEFTFGIDDIYTFELEADGTEQYAAAVSVAWDSKTQKLSRESKGADLSLGQGDLNGKKVGQSLGRKELHLQSLVEMPPAETKAWADGRLARTRLALYRGTISVEGIPKVDLLDGIEFKKFGKHFNGKNLITGIRHRVDPDGWVTDLQVGLPADPAAYLPQVMDSPAGGLLPGVSGLQIGVVDQFKEDPDKKFRLRVILPSVDPKKGAVWARLASPDAGKERGFFFRPEKGDEVVVGFLNDDPRQPVVLGALFSPVNVPPKGLEKMTAKNFLKGLVSREGVQLLINDEDKILTLTTSEKQHILLDEKKKTIEILDVNKNKITLSDKGITVESADKLSIDAKGDIELKGKNITVDASANVTIKGSQVDIK